MEVENIYYSECSLNNTPKIYGSIGGSIFFNDMPKDPTPDQVVWYREHPFYRARKTQLMINLLGLRGGRPYVDYRLSRFAGESSIDWIGGTRADGSKATGRLQQTHAFPYLGRIAGKINQYVFSTPPERNGGDVDFFDNATRDGSHINTVMRQVSNYVLAAKWCWVGVDAPPPKPDGTAYSIAEKEAQKIRPYWRVWSPLDVVDWHFDDVGNLIWVKTTETIYEAADPKSKAKSKRAVRLWEKGIVTTYSKLEERDIDGKERFEKVEQRISLTSEVPFVLAGEIDSNPTPFDDLESINRTIMDLGSVDRANFFNASYPQMVLPASVINNAVNAGYANNATEAAKLVVGFKNPILIEKDDASPSYITPDSSAMLSISERIDSLKRDMFEVVGMALGQSSRQVASAEAKAWDFLDVASVMKARAELLEETERKLIAMSKKWDMQFSEWTVSYNRDFDVGNFREEIQALVMAGNMDLPTSMHRELVRKIADRIDRVGSPTNPEVKQKILDELNEWEPSYSAMN